MRLSDLSRKLLGLSETLHRWLAALNALDRDRRDKVAEYADQIAATLARAAEALARLEADPQDRAAGRQAVRELGRIAGYVETIVGVLEHHLDGRKLAGVKRRLERIEARDDPAGARRQAHAPHIEHIVAAEGYFRALADGLRT